MSAVYRQPDVDEIHKKLKKINLIFYYLRFEDPADSTQLYQVGTLDRLKILRKESNYNLATRNDERDIRE